jgi:hypothetical protein
MTGSHQGLVPRRRSEGAPKERAVDAPGALSMSNKGGDEGHRPGLVPGGQVSVGRYRRVVFVAEE